MESYPLGKTSFAVSVTSASLAERALFLTSRINTSSIALNFSGSIGPSGSSYTKVGLTGPDGPRGPSGSKGLGVYLLSSSRATCCNRFDSFGAGWYATTNTTGLDACDTGTYSTLIDTFVYSTGSSVGGALQVGYPVNSNSGCTFPISGYTAIHNGSGNYYELNSSGVVTNVGTCSF